MNQMLERADREGSSVMAQTSSLSSSTHTMKRGREQCYICWTSHNPSPPQQSKSLDELNREHHEYLRDLEQRGILFGAGSLQDENGKRFGAGMFIIRARTRAEAEAIALREPLTVAGMRTIELTPWRRSAGSTALTINFANGRLQVDTRSYALTSLD
jgi:uncharacterized protein YciI